MQKIKVGTEPIMVSHFQLPIIGLRSNSRMAEISKDILVWFDNATANELPIQLIFNAKNKIYAALYFTLNLVYKKSLENIKA
jgi:hypothetical protein